MGIGVLGTAGVVIGYGILTESLAAGFGVPALGGTPAGAAGPAAGATAGMSLGTTGLLWGRLMGSPGFHGPVANAAQVAPTTGTPTQGGGQSAASQNKGGIETGTSNSERSLERLDRGGDYSELPVQDDGNYLGQRMPPRRPRGAPMPGGGGPVLKPAPRQYWPTPRPGAFGSPEWYVRTGVREIAGTRGLEHSFARHAAQWFGRPVPARTHMSQWQSLVERATQSRLQVNWSLEGTSTVGHLAKIEGKFLFTQFYATGPRAGELATAFVPNQGQLRAIISLLLL